jgi:hypothetical protein
VLTRQRKNFKSQYLSASQLTKSFQHLLLHFQTVSSPLCCVAFALYRVDASLLREKVASLSFVQNYLTCRARFMSVSTSLSC